MTAYYNEFDAKKAAWLRQLIKEGVIAPGVVDERSILDVRPSDLRGFEQCHFFAGIGIWSYALRLVGWPDNRPVWTGSCPCQPFSSAGRGNGFADERHVWPYWFHIIQHGKRSDIPIYGEQVASRDGLAWLDLVSSDLEGTHHNCRSFDLCAAGFGSPNIRQRLFWVADTASAGSFPGAPPGVYRGEESPGTRNAKSKRSGESGGVADMQREGLERLARHVREWYKSRRLRAEPIRPASPKGFAGRMGDAESILRRLPERQDGGYLPESIGTGEAHRPGPLNGFWRNADWLGCRDGKWRPVESGTFPLAYGAAERVLRLRGYGDGINAEVAAAFIEAREGAK